MNFIKAIFVKLGTGFLYGAGFMIAAAVVGNFTFSYMESDMEEMERKQEERNKNREEKMRMMSRSYDESAGLSVSIAKERIADDEFTLIGTIENNGDTKWSSVSLKAELFNEDGEFIDECTEYVNQTTIPGSKLNFKLSCGSCSKFQLRDYKSYKLAITDAMYSR